MAIRAGSDNLRDRQGGAVGLVRFGVGFLVPATMFALVSCTGSQTVQPSSSDSTSQTVQPSASDSTSPTVQPTPPAQPAPGERLAVVPPSLFGMHVNELDTKSVSTGANAVRLWDTHVTWRELQPVRGPINWSPLDAAIANASASGMNDIQYVFGSTPQWAAESLKNRGEVRGPGSASHPKNDADYLEFVRKVVERYRGKINSYQVWNEADLPDFYAGSAEQLAELTARTYTLIKRLDPAAQVAAAGLVPRDGRFTPGSFEDKYLIGLKDRGWPIDAFEISMYPVKQDISLKAQYVALVKAALTRNEAPPKQLWESEANLFSESGELFPTQTQKNLLARTYISSQELGISRTYWYSWAEQLPYFGIHLTTPAGVPTPAAAAYRTIEKWMSGKNWKGCEDQQGVQVCGVGSGNSWIFFRDSGASKITAPKEATQLCTLNGQCRPLRSGAMLAANSEPKLMVAE